MNRTFPKFSSSFSCDVKWDGWNRLVEVKNTVGPVVATCQYDGATRRVTKATGSATRHYYYSDQWQVLEERLDSGSGPVLNRQFVWGIRSIDDLILRDRDTTGNGALNERLYALHDAMSVTAVVNTSGTVQERYGYDGFGQPRYMDGTFGTRGSSSFAWEILFDAYRYDIEIGLYQVRFRYLHPMLGRWLARDEIKHDMQTNLFMFVRNSPLNQFDVFGLQVRPRPIPSIITIGTHVIDLTRWLIDESQLVRSTMYEDVECPEKCCRARVYEWHRVAERGIFIYTPLDRLLSYEIYATLSDAKVQRYACCKCSRGRTTGSWSETTDVKYEGRLETIGDVFIAIADVTRVSTRTRSCKEECEPTRKFRWRKTCRFYVFCREVFIGEGHSDE